MKRYLGVLALFLTLLAGSALAGDDTVLAKVGNIKLTVADFNRITSYYYGADKQKSLDENLQKKAALLKKILHIMVISDIARAKGFDKLPGIKEHTELVVNDFLTTEYLRKEVIDKIDITEEDLSLYYKTHQAEFKTPELVKAGHILIKVSKSATDDEKKMAREKIEGILKRIRAGEDFAKLASEFSDDPASKKKGGDLGFLTKGRMMPEVEKVSFSLKPGEISDIVETVFGYQIIRVEDKKEAGVEPFDKVKGKINAKVFAEFKQARVSEFVDKSLKEAGAEIYFDVLAPKK